MYRVKLKNLESGKEIQAWESYSKPDKEYLFYYDIECTKKIDMSQYKSIDEDPDGIPFYLFGIECGKGWIPLIKPIIEYIDKYNEGIDNPNEKIHILQIKEKWAQLVIYVSHGTKELYDMIDKAEDESQYICECCGTRENLGTTQGYYMTICHDCCKEMAMERNFGAYKWLNHSDNKLYWIYPEKDKEDEYIATKEEYERDMP